MRYWDSSAVVPLLTRQPATRAAEALLQSDATLLVWWGTPVECTSALARLERDQLLESEDVTRALVRLRALANLWHEVIPHQRIRATAERLLRVHPLHAADSLQLAAALEVAGTGPSKLDFVCFDRRLGSAAAREGLTVLAGQQAT